MEQNLVFSSNSFLGAELIECLKKKNIKVIGTTRRKSDVSEDCLFLDLDDEDSNYNIPKDIHHAYLLAGRWGYQECEKDPDAWRVNVINMTRLAKILLEQDIFVTFVSSNTVFGGERPWCNEDDFHDPLFAYAQHKAAAEAAISELAVNLNKTNCFNIVRLTKILGIQTSPIPNWIGSLERGELINPFKDLIFAPISVRYTAESLAKIGQLRLSGNFHISGSENIPYDEFLIKLAEGFGFRHINFKSTTSIKMNINIPFKPTYSGLGMERTNGLTGLEPQSLENLIQDLNDQYKASQ